DRTRGHGQQGVRRATLLLAKPGHHQGRGRNDDRERLHRTLHQGASDRVRRRAESPDPARDDRLRRLNGVYEGCRRRAERSSRRTRVAARPLAAAASAYPELVQRYLFSAVKPERDKFAALHAALFSGGSFLYVPDGVTVEQPLVSQFWSGGPGAAVLPHSLVVAGKGSRFQFVDQFLSSDRQEATLASGSSEVFLEEGAEVGYVALQHWSVKTWQFANQRFHLGRDARLRMVDVALGAHLARLRVEAILEGPGSSADMRGLFFGTG